MSLLSRRQFLTASAGLATLGLLGPGCGTSGDNPGFQGSGTGASNSPILLPQPQVLTSSGGQLSTTLQVQLSKNVIGNRNLFTATYNGTIPGPTLRIRRGDRLVLNLVNNLPPNRDGTPPDINIPHSPNTTNIHTHGLHVSPRTPSDNVLLTFDPGSTFTYTYNIPANHPAGVFWYHPHNHGAVATQMWGGMGGALIIEGDIDEVPGIKEAKDVLLYFQELRVNAQGIVPSFADQMAFFAQVQTMFTINGVRNPTIVMKRGEVQRWRLVNGNVNFFLQLQLEGHELHLVAQDGITLSQVQTVDNVLLAPANRATVLVRAGAPGTYTLSKLAYDQGPAAPPPVTPLATVIVTDEVAPSITLPTTLPAPFPDITDAEITKRRQLTFEVQPPNAIWNVGQFEIDNAKFSDTRVDQIVTVGTAEEWTLFNTSNEDHPFHIHINPFQVVAINGRPVPKVWLDTVNVPKNGNVTIRHRFRDFSGQYVLHCHILMHECLGMMQVVEAVDAAVSHEERQELNKRLARFNAQLAQGLPGKTAPDEFCGPYESQPRRMRWGPPA